MHQFPFMYVYQRDSYFFSCFGWINCILCVLLYISFRFSSHEINLSVLSYLEDRLQTLSFNFVVCFIVCKQEHICFTPKYILKENGRDSELFTLYILYSIFYFIMFARQLICTKLLETGLRSCFSGERYKGEANQKQDL